MKRYTDLDFDNVARPVNVPTPVSSGDGPNKAYVDPPADLTTTLVGEDVKDVWKRLYWPTLTQVSAYAANKLTSVTFYKNPTQTAANRMALSTLTYSGNNPTTEVVQLFDLTDGVTVLKTITRTFTFSGNDLLSVAEVTT